MKRATRPTALMIGVATLALAGCSRDAERAVLAAFLFVAVGVGLSLFALTVAVVVAVRARPTSARVTLGLGWSALMAVAAGAATTPSDFTLDPLSTEFLWSAAALGLPGVLALVTLAVSIAALARPPPEE